MPTSPRWDVVLCDPGAGDATDTYINLEQVGLILDEPLTWSSAIQMATKITEATTWRSFDQWSVLEQSSWHHGRGLERWDSADPERFYDSFNVDTRIRDQMTLAPGQVVYGMAASTYPYPGTGGEITTWLLYDTTASGVASKMAQGFKLASGCNVTSITIRLKSYFYNGTAGKYLTLRVETDNGSGKPSGTLVHANATATVDCGTIFDSVTGVAFSFTSFALASATQYHLVLSHNDTVGGYELQGTFAAADGYTNGAGRECIDGTWTADPRAGYYVDYFCSIPASDALAGTVACFAQFNGKMYCGAGKAVYQWDNTNSYWVAKKTDFANDVTDMVDFASLLWVAHSDGNLWTFDGTSTWTEKSGKTAAKLTVYKGYLYRSTYSTDNQVWYTPDGTYWAATGAEYAWKVGNPGRLERITSIAGHAYGTYAVTTHGLYMIGPETEQGDLVDQVKSWESQYDTDNGKGAITWARDGKLYIPVLGGLLSYSDGFFESVGPDRDAGLPAARQGNIVDLISLTNWLVAAVDAGTSGTSSVLVYNGTGWHELVRTPQAGQACRALGYDTTVTPHRLWCGYGTMTGYVQLPDLTDNPYQATGSEYASEGYVITPWISFDLLGSEKDFQEFGLQYQMPTSGSIKVEYEVDHSGLWSPMFTITATDAGNVYVYEFPFDTAAAPVTDYPTVAAGSTAKTLNLNTAVYLDTYDWLRINDEVRQMMTYVTDTQIVLARPLSSTPATGTRVYKSRPCGAEIRFKITLSVTDIDETPKVESWWLKAMPMLQDKLAGRIVATIRDGDVTLDGAETPEVYDTGSTAAARVAMLHAFAKRPNPIYCYDRRGTRRTVKITNISESQVGPIGEDAIGHQRRIESKVILDLVEV
jgi:hypothetical protein